MEIRLRPPVSLFYVNQWILELNEKARHPSMSVSIEKSHGDST
jgi:hypothetical protein